MSTATNIGTLIVSTPDICGGRPRIAGRRISVEQISVLHKQGLTPDNIKNEYEGVSLEQIYAAIAYYYANQQEIETYLDEDKKEYDRLMLEFRKED